MQQLLLPLIITLLSTIFIQESFSQERLPSKNYDLYISKGIIEFDAGKYDKAKTEIEKALEERHDDPDGNYYLGLIYLELGRLKDAEDRLKRVIELEPSYQGAHYQLGIVYYKQGAYNDALTAFSDAEKREPPRGMIYYYQGLIYHKQGNYDKTPPLFLKAVTLVPEVALTSHYYSALSYYKRGDFEDAEEEFNETVRLEPDSDIARSSRKYLEEIGKAQKGSKRWDLSLSLSLQYDTNVVLEPDESTLAAQIARNQDTRSVAFLRGGYQLLKGDSWNVGAGYSFYSSLHHELSEFNTLSHDLLIYGDYTWQRYQARIQYDFNSVSVNNNRYLVSHSINPFINISERDRYITQISYRYQLKDFLDTAQFTVNSERDGTNNSAGLTQFIFFQGKNGNLRIGYFLDSDSTDGPDWDYDGHRILFGLGFPVIKEIKLDLLAEYNIKGYKNPNSLSPEGDKRDDALTTYTIGISRDFKDYLTAGIQYLYSRNDSNIAIFEYNRNIYSFTIAARL